MREQLFGPVSLMEANGSGSATAAAPITSVAVREWREAGFIRDGGAGGSGGGDDDDDL